MLLTTVTLPKVVNFLLDHELIRFHISSVLCLKFKSIISLRCKEKVMPKTVNGSLVQLKLYYLHNFSVLNLFEPIQMHLVLS